MASSISRATITPSARTNLLLPSSSSRRSRHNERVAGRQGSYAFKLCMASPLRVKCSASETEKVAEMSKFQKKTAELLAELLKSENPQLVAQKNVDSFTEEFFVMSSTYMEMARKEGNKDMVKRIESALKMAMDEKGKTLRPEIRLLNQLLQQPSASDRSTTFKSYLYYLKSDSYFFELLRMMTKDVQMQMDSPQKLRLQKQLEIIKREAEAISMTLEKAG